MHLRSTVNLGDLHLFNIHLHSIVFTSVGSHALKDKPKIMIWRCPSSVALSHNPSWWCASFRHSFKSSYVITSVIAMFQRITQDEDMRLSFKCSVVSNCCWSSLDHGTFFNNIAFGVIWMCSFIYYLLLLYFSHCPLFIDSSFSHLSLPPSWSNYCLCFLFMVHCIAPMWFNFSRSVEKNWCHFCQGFRRLNWYSSLSDNLPSGINSHISKTMSIQV